MKNAANSGYVSYDPKLSDGGGDHCEHHIPIGFFDLHRNRGRAPHIRESRTEHKPP
jgi:hypothetical protein